MGRPDRANEPDFWRAVHLSKGGQGRQSTPHQLGELARDGARRMIATPLEAEVGEYVERHARERGEDGRRPEVRSGRVREHRVPSSGCTSRWSTTSKPRSSIDDG